MDSCSYYLELLSQSLDQPLSLQEQAALQAHLDQCPDCRLLAQQLTQIHSELSAWEDQEVPEGFTQGVMDQVRALDTPKNIIPLWKRPQFKAVGSLAACAVLCLGLWSSGLFSGSASMDSSLCMDVPAGAGAAQGAPNVPAPAAFQMTGESDIVFSDQAAPQTEDLAVENEAVSYDAISAPASTPMLKSQSSVPNEASLLALAAQAVGVTPGTLLLVGALPDELAVCGTWHDADGMMFFLFDTLPSQSEQQTLLDAASDRIGQDPHPLVLLIIE